ncbi:MAG: GlmU family protein [Bacteroidales bacterium]|nr:GlmU family protein [Bacteroidales bacterium]MDY0141555.1 GlmU family protein [Bacteroidales bacterium]
MNIILSDKGFYKRFLPLTYTRSVADYRVGILTIKEKWEKLTEVEPGIITEKYLQNKYSYSITPNSILVQANVIPNHNFIEALKNLKDAALTKDGEIIAYTLTSEDIDIIPEKYIEYKQDLIIIKSNTDVFSLNGKLIQEDYNTICADRKSAEISSTNIVFGKHPVFVEEGCFVECSTINTSEGPVYIGKNVKIMEGSHIRGPFAICENSEIKMGAKIYGSTTIGPECKVGGEINNSVFFAFSNKAHDGFLGNAVIGEWCNIGADSNNSNLKNNYAVVKLWDYESERFKNTGLQFCGLIMGDHSKCGINTMFNTGTVIGVSANVFGSGFPRNFVPSFSWGGYAGLSEYKLNIAFDVMEKVMMRRNIKLTQTDKDIFEHIFEQTAVYRKF